MDSDTLRQHIVDQLEDLKARDLTMIDVRAKTSITDYMFVCSGTSNRHVKSIAESLVVKLKELGAKPLGVEGDSNSEWVLVDCGDVIVHVMQANARDYYQIEKLWMADTPS
ncbi:ribosome silencing factor [Pleionea sp. CnH1-48]|uniref:ribosome silencing factor n=1 Tax=Pleionea sp. CnH1-48 TaxID=2954494 RepID=UPI002096CEBD|nr:ribosome silencing factor [Pleionea sp. CnH1-48]MCO7227382.1 ribosome silencing factor [Pleionea sp. CnH1-48]